MRNGLRRPRPSLLNYFLGTDLGKGDVPALSVCAYWSPHQVPKDSFKTMVTQMVLVKLTRSKHQTKSQESEKEMDRKEWILIGVGGK